MAERVFARKLEKAGFVDIEINDHTPMTIDDVARFPLYPTELIELMRRTMLAPQQANVATSVIIRARKPLLTG